MLPLPSKVITILQYLLNGELCKVAPREITHLEMLPILYRLSRLVGLERYLPIRDKITATLRSSVKILCDYDIRAFSAAFDDCVLMLQDSMILRAALISHRGWLVLFFAFETSPILYYFHFLKFDKQQL